VIEYVKGDLFDTDIPVIVHGCNAQGVMGSGVAKQIKEKFPQAYIDYLEDHKYHSKHGFDELPLGRIITTSCNSKTILSVITQRFYGRNINIRYCSYDAIAEIFNKLGKQYTHLAIPQIGAGLANGSWDVIEAIINSEAKHTKIKVYIL
jgi:O-acetyl-ADP-ribose deacetylase (regulator of RNase III)